jgi:hypothetical protein
MLKSKPRMDLKIYPLAFYLFVIYYVGDEIVV